jgi:hypothetical protein
LVASWGPLERAQNGPVRELLTLTGRMFLPGDLALTK